MNAIDINFKKGMKINLYCKNSYGREFDTIKKCIVTKIMNNKVRGQKIYIKDELNINSGIWKNEYKNNIEVVTE